MARWARAVLAGGLLSLGATQARADIIAFSGFEASGDTWTGKTLSGTGGSFSSATGATDTPALQRILDGTQSFQTNLGAATVDFDPVNVSAYTAVVLTLRLASLSTTTGNGADTADNVKVFVALNGGAFPVTEDLSINGNSNARWGFDATLTKSTTAGTPVSQQAPQAGTNTNNYSTLTVAIPNGTTQVDLRITATNDNAGEVWAVDGVTLSGSPVPEPSALGLVFASGAVLCGRRRRGATARARR